MTSPHHPQFHLSNNHSIILNSPNSSITCTQATNPTQHITKCVKSITPNIPAAAVPSTGHHLLPSATPAAEVRSSVASVLTIAPTLASRAAQTISTAAIVQRARRRRIHMLKIVRIAKISAVEMMVVGRGVRRKAEGGVRESLSR
jgi:hypothetical protein